MEKLQKEQQKFIDKVLNQENRELIEDESGLHKHLGEIVTIKVYFNNLTENLLAKLYPSGQEGKENESQLIPFWQIVKYQNIIPKEGDVFQLRCVVGLRRVFDTQAVSALRLPRN